MSGKLLLKLDATQYILQNHAVEDFPFMEDPANSRNRSTFYFILAKLLFHDEASSRTKFKSLIAPLQQARPAANCHTLCHCQHRDKHVLAQSLP